MTTSTTQAAPTTDAKVIPLQQFYLSMLCAVVQQDRLDVIQQEFDAQSGRLYMCSTGTSAPRFILSYRFGIDAMTLGVEGRDNRSLPLEEVKYALGLDAYLQKLARFLQSNRLTSKAA
jgi:hypothetical protein